MGCFSGCLISSASDQKLFCGVCSAFNWFFHEFVGGKVVSPSYSSTILAHPSSSAFSKGSLNIWKFTVLLKPGLENFEHYSLACEMSGIVQQFEHSLALPCFWIGIKTEFFQSCGHCWVFQICWHIECNTFTAPSFRIRNSSTGIPSPPLALFIVMLPEAHWTSHSRMSGSKWVITPSWLSGSLRSFLYSSFFFSVQFFYVFLPPLLKIFCFC